MLERAKIETQLRSPEAAYLPEDRLLETQRSSMGFISSMLFPLIALSAIVFASAHLLP